LEAEDKDRSEITGELDGLKALLRELEKSEQSYKSRIQSIHDIVYEVDVDGHFTFLSNSVEQLGYKPEELIGKHFKTIIHPDDIESVSREIVLPRFQGKVTGDECSPKLFDERRTANRMTKYLEVRLLSRKRVSDDDFIFAELHSTGKWLMGVDGKDNKFIGSIGIIRDISSRKAQEQKLKEAYDELSAVYKELQQQNKEFKKLDQLKSDFISFAAHEIKAPVTVIKEGISFFMDEMSGKLAEDKQDILNIAEKNIRRLTGLINSLLDISKIEAGRLTLYKELVDLSELIKSIAADFKQLAEKNQINISYKGLDEKTVFCDREKIERVFVNLISNAIKFTLPQGEIDIILKDEEDKVILSVQDTGQGIAKEDIPRLFDKYSQFGKKTYQQKGTGLGLAITKGIIDEHKGNIWVESELNKGTKFYFSLPKLSCSDIFKEYISREINKARKKKGHFSVVALKIQTKEEQARKDTILSKLEMVVKDTLRRKTDLVLKTGEGIYMILPETDKQSAFMVLARIKENLRKTADEAGEIHIKDIVVVYPGEVGNADEIINKLE